MFQRNRRRIFAVLTLLLSAGALSGCGCGPLGLNWCGHGGGYGGGYGGGPHYGPGGPGGWR